VSSVYVDTSLLVAAFCNEADQQVAMAVLRASNWSAVCVSDWTLAEFACALHAKVLRGDTPAATARTIERTLASLVADGALQQTAALREDHAAVRHRVHSMQSLVRGGDALHLAVAQRRGVTHFASLDKTQRTAATEWVPNIICEPLVLR
jgi:uncharacterized protein